MGLFDSDSEEPKSKAIRLTITALLLVILTGLAAWYFLRFQTEKNTARRFLEALAAGDTRRAHELWQPGEGYPYERFMEDWGPQGEFGPVRSFRIVAAELPDGPSGTVASGVVVVVEVSPSAPFEGSTSGVKEVKLWVERKDQSLSFAP